MKEHTQGKIAVETHTVRDGTGGYKYARIYSANNYKHEIALVTIRIDSKEDRANAQYIVTSWNNHEALVKALSELVKYKLRIDKEDWRDFEHAEQALIEATT
ncbi:hypothetical protein LCGC14_0872660 [marine sediment metagenome]|uniref:Uncharacterized protein n=1 Tax=marine sediment metagenome TaxID=412755 RepID=A0A0F9SB71_9ZZZZ